MTESELNRIAPYVGFSIKAGIVGFGFSEVVKMVQLEKASLVMIAKDAGENTVKRIRKYCNDYKVLLVSVGFSDEWNAILKINQKVIALKHHPLSDKIINVFGSMNG